MKTDVLGIRFDDVTLPEAVDRAAELMKAGGPHSAVTPNAEFVQMAEKDAEFRDLLNRAELVLPDGIGVVYAAKILGRPLKGKVAGIDFAAAVCERMAADGDRLFLLGAKPGIAELAAAALKTEHPGLLICGTHDGYFQESGPVADEIRAAGADAVFVCLGAPKQERWREEYGERCGAGLLGGLGGSLDVFAGQVKRAPERWQRLGLEWLYRLVKQPSRIGRMAKLPLFLCSAVGARMRKK